VHHVRSSGTAQSWIDIPGGIVEIGADGSRFAFDNEQPRHRTLMQPFRIARRLVTNREWLAFMDDGGYRRHELWLSDGWARVHTEDWQAPLYWIDDGGTWLQHTLSGTRPVDLDEPVVHVSHYEADAFAAWSGARLPTEAEWEVASETAGLDQVADQCWQWTASAYLPYPGFRAAPGAVGEYNGKFMSSQMVLRGGACVTPSGHARPTYRNFFAPHSRWAFSGVRLANDA
jgi:ergothioneine biosynthesis protein EgtB